jgi:hypothetical protein
VDGQPELSTDAERDVRTLVATTQGTLVISDYDPATCRAIWEQVKQEVEAWLDLKRPIE